MRIKYLGTGASEGIPAVFCHCPICQYARQHKGKNIRTRAQALIDDTILIDFGPDTYFHLLKYNINLANIYTCLITHSHSDHLYVDDILARRKSRAKLKENTPVLKVYGGLGVQNKFVLYENQYVTKDKSVQFELVKSFKKINLNGEYEIIPIPAKHSTLEPFIYIILKNKKCLLYAHDSDIFDDEVWNFFIENRILFDLVSLDCTEGKKEINYIGHMNFSKMFMMIDKMKKIGCINDKTIIIANHFSHNGLITYHEAIKIGKKYNIIISYDGMEVEI